MDDLALAKPRLALLLDHFSELKDERQSWRVAYPLREVLFLVVCATIANCDDYEDIADWGSDSMKITASCDSRFSLDSSAVRPKRRSSVPACRSRTSPRVVGRQGWPAPWEFLQQLQ